MHKVWCICIGKGSQFYVASQLSCPVYSCPLRTPLSTAFNSNKCSPLGWSSGEPQNRALNQVTTDEYELDNHRQAISPPLQPSLFTIVLTHLPQAPTRKLYSTHLSVRHLVNIFHRGRIGLQTKPNVRTALKAPWLPFCHSHHQPGSEAP